MNGLTNNPVVLAVLAVVALLILFFVVVPLVAGLIKVLLYVVALAAVVYGVWHFAFRN